MQHISWTVSGLCGLLLLVLQGVAGAAPPLAGTTWLTASPGRAYANFGAAIDVTPDGRTALIGANDGSMSPGPGAAYLFSAYAAAAGRKLSPLAPPANGHFGSALALADNGATAVVGAPSATVDGNSYQGLAYIFVNSGGWVQQARLADPDGATETNFGCAVDIADDGNTVLIASCSNPYVNRTVSSVSVFVRANGAWRLQEKFRGSDTGADDAFGGAVALSGDGNTALVGAFMATVNGNNDQGTAYVFVRSGGKWQQQQKLAATDGAQWDYFGNAVDLSNDGNLALVGDSRKGSGVAYVFARSAGKWSQQARLTPASPAPYSSNFAASLALTNDGGLAVIGDNGCARLFVRSGQSWREQEKLTVATPDYGFGSPVALADNGRTVLVASTGATVGGNQSQGVVSVFRPIVPLAGANMLLLRQP